MADTTVIPKPSNSAQDAPRKKYSDSAIREAYYKLLKDFHDPEKTLNLVSRTCRIAQEDVQRIVKGQPAPQVLAPAATVKPPEAGRLVAPEPAAMLALRHLALRGSDANSTILAAIHSPNLDFGLLAQACTASGFRTLPVFAQQNEYQRAIVLYVARVLDVKAEQVCFGACNVKVEGAEDRVGRASSRGLPMDDEIFEPFVAALRQSVKDSAQGTELHYLSLPPLDLDRLARLSNSVSLNAMPAVSDQSIELITDRFLRARSRDLTFVNWVAQRWPEGGKLEEVIAAIEYAEWLIALLSYTRYSSQNLEGKRMLTRLACVCATRAQRWVPAAFMRQALAVAECWAEEPTEENRVAAEKVKAELGGSPPETAPDGAKAYAWQAALESTLRAVSCAAATEPSRVSSHCSRAAAAAVAAASFAASAAKDSSWIELMSQKAGTGEDAEQRELCNAIRAVIYKG